MEIRRAYFLGIGGIGMSAIARYCLQKGIAVAGYDRTASALTRALEAEGAQVSYEDREATIPTEYKDEAGTVVVWTPAIPSDSELIQYFRSKGYRMMKRAEALGILTRDSRLVAVSGTHGKTTTSTLAAHILRTSETGCGAFLGGVSMNYETNYWGDATSDVIVTEADEYDRSFHQLTPSASVITSMDPDHLDIYGTHAGVIEAFLKFASLTKEGGLVVVRSGLPVGTADVEKGVTVRTYSMTDSAADYRAENIRVEDRRYCYDVVTPSGVIKDIRLGLPGRHNIDNSIAAIAVAQWAGASDDEIREACRTFRGNQRRFEVKYETERRIVVDDYAHHPKEIETTLRSIRELYPGMRLTVAFQPHLYTRTRDLAEGFATSLSIADRVWLIPIYPARELPIEGVSSEMIARQIAGDKARMTTKERLASDIVSEDVEVVVVMGAGDIDRLVDGVAAAVRDKK
ncbi:MAG: UDP-N-acetylmuramate--L-alanine ligase [Bacteroidales bacterium]|nr:UDP-N-acetylmuramate--L-alanine ligase [Bacteroidales bacterium]